VHPVCYTTWGGTAGGGGWYGGGGTAVGFCGSGSGSGGGGGASFVGALGSPLMTGGVRAGRPGHHHAVLIFARPIARRRGAARGIIASWMQRLRW
jgi:hypothetical protein